jgi:hypothetical protein
MLLRVVLPIVAVLFAIILVWFGCFGFSVKPKLIEKEIPVNQQPQ